MESEIKYNLRKRLQTGAKNVPLMKHLAAIFSNPLISTFVNKLMINYHIPMLFL